MKHKFSPNRLLVLPLLLSCFLLLNSCQNPGQPSDTTTGETTTSSPNTTTEAEPEPGTTILEDGLGKGSPVYVEDYEKYDIFVALGLYGARKNGNADLLQNVVPYENGVDMSFELHSSPCSLSKDQEWGISCSHIDEDLVLWEKTFYINIEKYENGKWVRYTDLNPERYVPGIPIVSATDRLSNYIREFILTTDYTIAVDQIFPEPTPGTYRFLFYVGVRLPNPQSPGTTYPEYRVYHIPFEVVE